MPSHTPRHTYESEPEAAPAKKPRKKGIGYWLGETILTVAALFGVTCVAVAIAAHVFGVSIILFKTGSMAPDIPAGSMALVKEIPASEIEVGDVITVDRPGQMPITHRVIDIEPAPDGDMHTRVITMQGDANPNPDPLPYTVTEGKRLFFAHPGWAKIIVTLSNPIALGIIALLASTLVIWVLWPRDDDEEDQESVVAS